MDPETEYDEEARAIRDRALELSLPSPHHDDKPQKLKEVLSTISSLPSPQPMHPNRPNQPIMPPTNRPLYTPKRQKDFRDKDIYFAIKWACGILTVAASIVFGIWAPLSYEATLSDNDTQDAMVSVLSDARDLASTANVIASDALVAASAQREAMGELYGTIGLMGRLAVVDFCYGQQTLNVCSSYIQEANESLGSLVDQLGHGSVVTTATTSASAAPSAATVDPENRGADAVPNAPPPAPAPANMPAPDPGAAAPASSSEPAAGAAPSSSEARPTTTGATQTSVPAPTATGAAASRPARKTPRLPVDAVLGIIFGLIGTGGAMLGFCVWRMRRRRMMLQGE